MWHSFTPLHTHSNIHTNQTACRHTIKYLKLITGVKYYEVKDYVHPPQKFSCNHDGTYQGYMHTIKISPTYRIYGKINAKIGKMRK